MAISIKASEEATLQPFNPSTNILTPQDHLPMTFYVHGHGDSADSVKKIKDFLPTKHKLINSCEFSNSTKNNFFPYFNAHLGHGADIETIKNSINKDQPVFFWAFSRGVAATINYIAEHKPKKIQGLVLQSGLVDIAHPVDHFQNQNGIQVAPYRWMKELIIKITTAPHYPLGAKAPIDTIQQISEHLDKQTPIFIFHSKRDRLIPVVSSYKLYESLLGAGFSNVYILDLEKGGHVKIDEGEKNNVTKALAYFYNRHNLSDEITTDQSYASCLQPTKPEIQIKIKQAEEAAKKIYIKKRNRNYMIAGSIITGATAWKYRKKIRLAITYLAKAALSR